MSPEARCPCCGDIKMFHDDEMEDLEEVLVVCLDCRLDVVIVDVVSEAFLTSALREGEEENDG